MNEQFAYIIIYSHCLKYPSPILAIEMALKWEQPTFQALAPRLPLGRPSQTSGGHGGIRLGRWPVGLIPLWSNLSMTNQNTDRFYEPIWNDQYIQINIYDCNIQPTKSGRTFQWGWGLPMTMRMGYQSSFMIQWQTMIMANHFNEDGDPSWDYPHES